MWIFDNHPITPALRLNHAYNHTPSLTTALLEEEVQRTTTCCQENSEPPPLVCTSRAGRLLEDDAVIQRQVTALDLSGGWGWRGEWVQSGSGQHFGGCGLVQGHHRGAVKLEDIEARSLAEAIDDYFVTLQEMLVRRYCNPVRVGYAPRKAQKRCSGCRWSS